MTDKQIPNERRQYEYKSVFTYTDNTTDDNDKIMENLHKQIIIDGVDVSGCENYGETMAKTHNCTLYDEYLRPCKGADCYYKQLKAKEQECEELKKKCNIYTCGICGNKEDCNKLYKTLAEIKEIAEVLITITDEYDNCYHKSECDKCLLGINGDCQYFKVEQILQKISEVE